MTETLNVKIVPEDANKIVKREIASLAFAIGASILLVVLQRKVSDPDFVLSCRMRFFNTVSRYADSKAKFWSELSCKATDMYLSSRP